MPAAWTFLIVLAMVGYLTKVPWTSWAEIKSCLFFYRNFGQYPGGNTAGHFWSLSIEEQFYLVWPWILLLFSIRSCRWVAALGAIGFAIFRWRMWAHYFGFPFETQVRADALLVGCLLALLLSEPAIRPSAAKWSRLLFPPAVGGLLLGIAFYPILQPLWESACIAILLASTMLHPGSVVSRVLSFRPLAWLGTVSYSLYVWQQPFMAFDQTGRMLAVSVGIFLPGFAVASYYLIERPCTRFGRRITEPATAETRSNEELLSARDQTAE